MTSPFASVMKIWFPVERDIALIIMLSSQLFIESFWLTAAAVRDTSSALATMSLLYSRMRYSLPIPTNENATRIKQVSTSSAVAVKFLR